MLPSIWFQYSIHKLFAVHLLVNVSVEFLAIAIAVVTGLWCFALAAILYCNLVLKEAGLSISQRHLAASGLAGLLLFPVIIPAGFAVPIPLPLIMAGPIIMLDGNIWDFVTAKAALFLGLFMLLSWLVILPFAKISSRVRSDES